VTQYQPVKINGQAKAGKGKGFLLHGLQQKKEIIPRIIAIS
jgi:hypothetical protein